MSSVDDLELQEALVAAAERAFAQAKRVADADPVEALRICGVVQTLCETYHQLREPRVLH